MKNQDGDIKRWEENVRDKYLEGFTPRIQRDIDLVEETEEFQSDLIKLRSGSSLLIVGGVGCGKTLYASKLALSCMRQTFFERGGLRNFCFETVPKLLNEIRDSFDNTEIRSEEVINKYLEADLLILDDLGVEKVTPWVLQTLYIIVNDRYEYLKPTIFTSNLSGGEMADKFDDDRIPSRIVGMCNIRHLGNKDRRIK